MAVATQIVKGQIVTRKCAEATAIPKGTVMKLTTDNTVIASSADNDPFGGITTEEFAGGEDKYSVACDMSGVYDIDTTAAAITAGQMVNLTAANAVAASVDGDFEQGSIVGQAETTRTGTDRIRVKLLGVGCGKPY